MIQTGTRFNVIDGIRMFLALLVVCIHVPCALKGWYEFILPVAVPGFFIISGFLMYGKSMDSYKRGIRKMLILTICSNLLYLPVYVFCGKIVDWRCILSWINWICINESIVIGHLWYLHAYLYVLVFFCLLGKYRNNPHILSVLFLITIFCRVYVQECGCEEIYFRNWLLCGIPFFALGELFRILYDKNHWNFLNSGNAMVKWLGMQGTRYSLSIYIMHPLMSVFAGYTLCSFFIFRAAMWWLGPFVIFVMSWLFSILLKKYLKINLL